MTTAVHPGAGPFDLGPSDGPRVLLFHGLTGAPSELWPLGVGLEAVGFHVTAPLWPGHGTRPEALARVSSEDLIGAARRAAFDHEISVIGGLSMGALLAIIAASNRPATKALVLLSPAFRLRGRNRLFTEVGRLPGVDRLRWMLPKGAPESGTSLIPAHGELSSRELIAAQAAENAPAPTGPDGRYSAVPLRWGGELAKLQKLAARAAHGVKCPVLILHGLKDQTADPAGALQLAHLLSGPVQTRFFAESPHLLTLGPERGSVAAEVTRFLQSVL